jgi:hypothetical protein
MFNEWTNFQIVKNLTKEAEEQMVYWGMPGYKQQKVTITALSCRGKGNRYAASILGGGLDK